MLTRGTCRHLKASVCLVPGPFHFRVFYSNLTSGAHKHTTARKTAVAETEEESESNREGTCKHGLSLSALGYPILSC